MTCEDCKYFIKEEENESQKYHLDASCDAPLPYWAEKELASVEVYGSFESAYWTGIGPDMATYCAMFTVKNKKVVNA